MEGEGFTRETRVGTHYQGRATEVGPRDLHQADPGTSSVGIRLSRGLADAGLTPTQLGVLEALLHLGRSGSASSAASC